MARGSEPHVLQSGRYARVGDWCAIRWSCWVVAPRSMQGRGARSRHCACRSWGNNSRRCRHNLARSRRVSFWIRSSHSLRPIVILSFLGSIITASTVTWWRCRARRKERKHDSGGSAALKLSASTIQKLNDFQTLPSDCYEFSTSRLPVRNPGLCREQPVSDRHCPWTLLMDDCALEPI